MSNRIPVHKNGTRIYDIILEQSFHSFALELQKLGLDGRKVCIVTDSNVAPIYLKEVDEIVSSCSKEAVHFVFPAGEEYKNLDTVKALYDCLIINHLDRQDYLVALGGGVVGDLCGFAAATYLRGISFIQIPTTLLSQVDSSIGGKTGVDFDAYKNMVGAFHMPKLVYSNLNTLLTLPEEQFSSGMGEIIKHGLIKSREYYDWLVDHTGEILSRDLAVCQEMIRQSDVIKRNVVELDPTEQGERALLNFGHTLGHAIEKLAGFRLMHGHCVGLGMIAAAQISASRRMISEEETARLVSVLSSFGIPVNVSGLDAEAVIETTKTDKKMDSGIIKFVLLKNIGEAYVDRNVSLKEMAEGLSYILN